MWVRMSWFHLRIVCLKSSIEILLSVVHCQVGKNIPNVRIAGAADGNGNSVAQCDAGVLECLYLIEIDSKTFVAGAELRAHAV